MATPEEMARAQAEMAEAQLRKDGDSITKLGRDYGAATFDHSVDRLVSKLGNEGIRAFTSIAAGFDAPHDVIVKLANDENRLDAISKMTPNQAAIELARIEAELSPHGAHRGGREAAWRQLEKNKGILSDHEWGSGMSDRLTEEQFQENWEHRQRKRAAKSPQPYGSRTRA
jgi:hypothetical protein